MSSLFAIVFSVFCVFVVARYSFEKWLDKRCREIYLKKRKIQLDRVNRQAIIRENLLSAGKSWRYNNNGVLVVGE